MWVTGVVWRRRLLVTLNVPAGTLRWSGLLKADAHVQCVSAEPASVVSSGRSMALRHRDVGRARERERPVTSHATYAEGQGWKESSLA
ncbi:hypothetical protein MTO96_015477 [Rhipicephalus appendiculatus]